MDISPFSAGTKKGKKNHSEKLVSFPGIKIQNSSCCKSESGWFFSVSIFLKMETDPAPENFAVFYPHVIHKVRCLSSI